MLHDRHAVYIPDSSYNSLKRSHIRKNDVLFTIVGANTGLVGLVYAPPEKLLANCKLGIARPKRGVIQPSYLYSFLRGKYGQNQLRRAIRDGGQTGIILPDLRKLKIVALQTALQEDVAEVTMAGHEAMIESKRVYSRTGLVKRSNRESQKRASVMQPTKEKTKRWHVNALIPNTTNQLHEM